MCVLLSLSRADLHLHALTVLLVLVAPAIMYSNNIQRAYFEQCSVSN
jgi:hypothetical protein